MRISNSRIWAIVTNFPIESPWPELEELFLQNDKVVAMDWRFPLFSCQACSGSESQLEPAVAAMACLFKSIIIIDDLLDNDDAGLHNRMGSGRAANLALALQAVATDLILQCDVSNARRLAACNTLNRAALDVAVGQERDTQNLFGEEHYWKTVVAKGVPYYAAAFQIGAQLGGADEHIASQLYQFGTYIGEIAQIYDDLEDAFRQPAEPDWIEGRSNLAILYGLTAEYEEKARFVELYKTIDREESLFEAQEILARSGSVSYCVYHAIRRERLALELLESLALPAPQHLADLFNIIRKPVSQFLADANIDLADFE